MNEISPTLLMSRDDRQQSEIVKVDPLLGAFCFFEGITSVMPLKTDLSNMHKSLARIVPARVGALLPHESYHVTLVSIACRCCFPSKEIYNEFIMGNLARLNELRDYLKSCEPGDIEFEVSKIDVTDRWCMLRVHPANSRASTYLNEALQKTCEILGMQQQKVDWHLTMMYPVYLSRPLTDGEVIEIHDTIKFHLEGKKLIFSKADLCRFDSMCRFDPL